MSPEILLLLGLMFAVTYPSRAVPLLVPGIDRLPPQALTYLRLVGPAILASLAVAVCAALVAWRRNLLAGLATAVVIVALARFVSGA